ncbi:MAG: T9SS type A sorting domain-containing protein [Flavobacteriales bacterium]|nr:T9SS type A sorting domain-containing protein [Flavobacteriales bacterium]
MDFFWGPENLNQLPMLRHHLTVLAVLVASLCIAQSSSEFVSVPLSATVQKTTPSITLAWTTLPNTSSITVYRKLRSATAWSSAIAAPAASATSYTDYAVTVGTAYEYKVVRVAGGTTGSGYLCSGIEVPAADYRGKIVLLVDNTFTSSLATELTQLQNDMKADGWTVLRTDLARTASVATVRSTVQAHYNADPVNVRALFIVGHLAVPYSGNQNPDGHSEHKGAWPCDGYYGELNGSWTDNSVSVTSAARTANNNVPGDGKFDQSDYPSALELQVGRVDMYDMPAFSQTETQLTRNYLIKLHNYKVKGLVPQERAILFDNLQWAGSPMAGSGWRGFSTMVGAANVTAAPGTGFPFTYYVNGQSYLWSYASGGGLQATVGGVLTYNGASNVAITDDYANTVALGSVFNMSFGSYFGDWDNKNNFLRAALASGDALVNCYAAIPAWYVHHMGLGETIGTSTLATMNNTALYTPLTDGWQGTIGRVHLGLMGDPTLRTRMVAPPSNFSVANAGGLASFAWTASAETVLGYHIDRINANGSLTRINTTMITGTTFQNAGVPFVAGAQYMVRAIKLQTTPSGSFFNLSLGAFSTAAGGAPAPDCQGVVGGTALPGAACNDGNACTISDTWNTNCQCVGVANSPTATITPASTTTFCTGGSVNLNASTGAGYAYTWSRNGTVIAGATASTYNSNTSGSHTVTVTRNGCAVTSPGTTVTVNALPTIVCTANGTAGTVTATISGPPGPYVYAWTTNPIQTTATATVSAAGTYTVGVTAANGCSQIASVNYVPSASAPVDCQGVVGGPAVPGANCNDGNACTINDKWSANCQCVGTPTTVTATVTAGGSTTFCAGGSVTLSANTGVGYTYVWKRNGTTITGATGSTYVASTSGSHTVTITSGGCSNTSAAVTVTAKPLPVVVCTTNTAAGTITAAASVAPSPYTYSWTTNPVQTTATATVSSAGTYAVTVMSSNGCGSSATATYTPPVGTTICDGLRTESQATWGATSNGSTNPAAYMTAYFGWLYTSPDYLTIGCGSNKLKLTTAAAVSAFLPSTGAVAALPAGTLTNPGSGYSNALAGELVALKLTLKFDAYNPWFSTSQLALKDMVIGSGPFAGMTVAALATEADKRIGGCTSSYTLAQLHTAISTINNGYEGGTEAAGYLLCNGVPKLEIEEEVLLEDIRVTAFPNPFNGVTTLAIHAMDEAAHTTVEVFSMTGVLVTRLYDGEMLPGGDLLMQWDASGQPMGMYFYRVTRADRSVSGKLILE